MTEHESALADLYDHEVQGAPAGERRQAADWGGDDLFTSMPRRRRFDHPARADRGADHFDRGADHFDRRADHFDRGADRSDRPSDHATRFEPADRPARGARTGTRADHADRRRRDTTEHPVQRSQRSPVDDAARRRSPLELPDVTERTIPLPETAAAPAVAGRRTVTITGHPDRVPARRRPAPSLDERIYGSNPERIAMYAFALGLLLIVIALLSANA